MLMLLLVAPSIAHAGSLNAGAVLNEMDAKQRYAYVSGVVEGLAYSRFLTDKPNEEGMTCIYDWYYEGNATEQWTRITTRLKRHPDKPVGVLMHILIKKDCGL